jgi:hypothetical protein
MNALVQMTYSFYIQVFENKLHWNNKAVTQEQVHRSRIPVSGGINFTQRLMNFVGSR